MNQTPQIKGIRIRTVNLVTLTLSVLLFVIVFWITLQIYNDYASTTQATEKYVQLETAAHQIHVSSDFLTETSRLYTQTGQKKHAEEYFRELHERRTREKAVDSLRAARLLNDPDDRLFNALNLSNAMTHREIYAMRLAAEAYGADLFAMPASLRDVRPNAEDRNADSAQKLERARDLLFSDEYMEAKKRILGLLDECLQKNLEMTSEAQQDSMDRLGRMLDWQRLALLALCLLNVLTFSMIIFLIVRPLQICMNCIMRDKTIEMVGAYEFRHLALIYNDIFAIKEYQERMLRHKAEHDPLTGLLNRSAFDSISEMLRHDKEAVGLLLIDVDKFKDINDTWGHAVGDKALCRVAALLQHSFRSDDFCVRMGGDEFAVILHGMTPVLEDTVKAKIAGINAALQAPRDDLPPLSLSVGVAVSASGFVGDLYQKADLALYAVKEAGRNGCAFYDESLHGTPQTTGAPDSHA